MNIISPAFQIIADFYSAYALKQAINRLSSSLKAATKKKIWKGSSPADLLYFYDQLDELLRAAYLLQETNNDCEEAKLKPPASDYKLITNWQTWCGWHCDSTPWHYFPRYLSKKEFLDPYRAIKKIILFQSYAQWQLQLKEILQHALSSTPYAEFHEGEELLNIWLQLHKLLEATHLIEVRAIIEDENGARPKWKQTQLKKTEKEKQTIALEL